MRITEVGYFLKGSVCDPRQEPKPFIFEPQYDFAEPQLVSCIMPTRGHVFPARHSIECFRRQDYPRTELVVVCAAAGSEVEDYVAGLDDPRIRFFRCPGARNVGEMRNFALDRCKGDLVSIWDDDDLSPPYRLAMQVCSLQEAKAGAAFLARVTLWSPAMRRLAISQRRPWEGTMLAERAALPRYQSRQKGEDTALVTELANRVRMVAIDHPAAYCYVLHGRNVWDAGHFRWHFSRATRTFDGDLYTRVVTDLAARIPIADYALEFKEAVRRARAAPKPTAQAAQSRAGGR